MEKININSQEKEVDNENLFKIQKEIEEYLSNIKQHTADDIEKAWAVNRFDLGNSKVEFLSVMHTPETLLRYWEEINIAIDSADVVVLEAAPSASGMTENEDFLGVIQEHYKKDGRELSKKEISEYLQNDPSIKFYDYVERLAAIKGKNIAVVDPEAQGLKLFNLEKTGETSDIIKAIIGIGGTAGFLASVAHGLIKKIRDNKDGKEGDTRRGFIKELAKLAGFIGVTLSYSNYASLIESSKDKPGAGLLKAKERGRIDNPLGAFLYDTNDFRDVCISKGISKATEHIEDGGKVVIIYGASHESAIEYYSTIPAERDARFAMYGPYRLGVSPEFIEHQYNKDKKEWERVCKEKL